MSVPPKSIQTAMAAIIALTVCRLVQLDKQPRTRPIEIGEVYRRLMAKDVLVAAGHIVTKSYGNFSLCA